MTETLLIRWYGSLILVWVHGVLCLRSSSAVVLWGWMECAKLCQTVSWGKGWILLSCCSSCHPILILIPFFLWAAIDRDGAALACSTHTNQEDRHYSLDLFMNIIPRSNPESKRTVFFYLLASRLHKGRLLWVHADHKDETQCCWKHQLACREVWKHFNVPSCPFKLQLCSPPLRFTATENLRHVLSTWKSIIMMAPWQDWRCLHLCLQRSFQTGRPFHLELRRFDKKYNRPTSETRNCSAISRWTTCMSFQLLHLLTFLNISCVYSFGSSVYNDSIQF